MLSIIDRFILRKFLTTFFFMLGIIMMFSMVFDISDKLSEFISNKAPISDIIFDYYLNFIFFYGNLFSSMIIFISVIWFTSKMAQTSEITALRFSGISIFRYYKPYFLGATFLMIISLIFNHFISPNANKKRIEFEEKYYNQELKVKDYNADYPNNQSVNFSNYSNFEGKIHNFSLIRWNEKKEVVYFLKARYAMNLSGTKNWQLFDYYEKYISFPKGKLKFGSKKDTIFSFGIDEMENRINIAEMLTSSDLKKLISQEKLKGSKNVSLYQIEFHQRTSYPFAAYILTSLGFSVASRKKRGGMGINIAIGLGFVFIYIFTMKLITVASLNLGFPPILAVWTPNVLFGIIAFFFFRFSQK